MQTAQHPRCYGDLCARSLKSLRNQCTGKKELGVYLRNLQRENISEYRAKIRGCRIIEPNAADGTPGLRSVAERARGHSTDARGLRH